MAYTLTTAITLGASQTGLALSAQLKDTIGVNVGGAITSGFVELGLGMYLWHSAAYPAGFRGVVAFSAGGALKAIAAINPEEGEYLDAAVSTRAIAGATVTVAAPVGSAGDIVIVRGDDYSDTDGRALQFTLVGAPDLTTASAISFTVVNRVTGTSLAVSALAGVTATVIKVSLTAAQTAAFALGAVHSYDIQATFSGRKRTLVEGTLTVVEDYAA